MSISKLFQSRVEPTQWFLKRWFLSCVLVVLLVITTVAAANLWKVQIAIAKNITIATFPFHHKKIIRPDTSTTGWKTYTNSQYGFEFKYPPQGDVEGNLDSPQANTHGLFVWPSAVRGGGTGLTLNIWLDPYGKYHVGAQTQFAGKPAYISQVKSEYGGGYKRIALPGVQADMIIESGNAAVFTQILSTFKFTK